LKINRRVDYPRTAIGLLWQKSTALFLNM